MAIRQITTDAEIDRQLEEYVEQAKYVIARRLCHIGEQVVNKMRMKHANDYTDRTGNLRSSTGYVVVMDGKIVEMSAFETVKQGADGSNQGKAFVKELASKFPTDTVLIVVAGMDYAYYVQNKHERDVTISGELLANELLKKQGLKTKVKRIQ